MAPNFSIFSEIQKTMKYFKIFLLVTSVILSGCALVTPPTTTDVPPAHNDYVVQPGDILEISVWKEKDLQREVLVRPDGGLNFPLAGDIIASGQTIDQLQKDITAKLTKFVPDPVVSVAVKQAQGYKIFVVGKVNKPGEFIANRNVDVMQALSMAGGITPFAAENKIKILRRVKGELVSIPFRYSAVEKGQDLSQNIVLEGGDVVVVP
jgi:polysaccharide export outer membrane protein